MARNIEDFATYALLTDELVMSGPETFVNDSNLYERYSFFDAWSLRRDIQATAVVKDFIELDTTTRGSFISANHKWDLKGRDGMSQYNIGWAVYGTYTVYEDEERQMNEADRRAQYKRLFKQKIVQMHTETADVLEGRMWNAPTALMESIGADEVREPYSIPALITPGGLVSSVFTTASITTKFGIDPAVKTNWQNASFTFNDFSAQIERRLFRAKYLTDFRPPRGAPQGSFTGTPLDRRVIYTDLATLEDLRQILRDSNDRLRELGEFDGQLTYSRTPITWAVPLGGADTAVTARRLFGVNFDFLYPIMRDGIFMKLMLAPYGGAWKPHDMPRSNVIYEFTEYNWWIRSLRRQFVIYHESNSW